MTTTFNWTIPTLERNTADGFVTTAHWRCTGTDGKFYASNYGTASFTEEPNNATIPYEELTEAIVIGWVQDKLNQAVVEASLQSQIDAQKNPVKATGTPW